MLHCLFVVNSDRDLFTQLVIFIAYMYVHVHVHVSVCKHMYLNSVYASHTHGFAVENFSAFYIMNMSKCITN